MSNNLDFGKFRESLDSRPISFGDVLGASQAWTKVLGITDRLTIHQSSVTPDGIAYRLFLNGEWREYEFRSFNLAELIEDDTRASRERFRCRASSLGFVVVAKVLHIIARGLRSRASGLPLAASRSLLADDLAGAAADADGVGSVILHAFAACDLISELE